MTVHLFHLCLPSEENILKYLFYPFIYSTTTYLIAAKCCVIIEWASRRHHFLGSWHCHETTDKQIFI